MADYIQRAFNAGEVCEEAQARNDIAQSARGVRSALNGMFMVHGGWRRRKGTWAVAQSKTGSGDFALIPFTRAFGQSVVLEAGVSGGAGYMRVYGTDRARVGSVDIALPFAQSELGLGLSYLQSGDALQVYRRNGKRPQVIQRLGAENWACVPLTYRHGPWMDENASATTLTFASSTVGGVTASTGVFSPEHVGTAFLIKPQYGLNVDAWRGDWRAPDGSYCLSGGHVYYKANDSNPTGFNPPVHREGTVNDAGTNQTNANPVRGVNWSYENDGAQIFNVEGYSSATSISGGFAGTSPFYGVTPRTTKRWSERAYSDYRGWPTMAPCIREERIVSGATPSAPDKLDMTRTNGWDLNSVDHKPGLGTGLVVADDAIRMTVGQGAALKWALDFKALLVASEDEIFVVLGGGGTDTPMKPDSKIVRAEVFEGASDVLPAKTKKTVVYVPVARKTLVEISNANGEFDAGEISLMFQHITGKGVAQVVYMGPPWHLLVLRLDDGSVSFVSYNKDQNVLAAAQQDFGGRVFTVAVVKGANKQDQLWLGIERDGVRMIEVMAGLDEPLFVDSAAFYEGAGTNVVTGLSRFNGRQVQACADGAWIRDVTPQGGTITLDDGYTAAYVQVGIDFLSRLEFMPQADAQEGFATLTAKADRVKFFGRWTHAEFGTTDDEGDQRPDPSIHRDGSGKWIEKKAAVRSNPYSTAGEDKRVFIQTRSPFDLVVYSAKVGAEIKP